MAYITIPTILRKYTNQIERLNVSGATVQAILQQLFQQFPALENLLFKQPGILSQYVNLYLNKLDVRNDLNRAVTNEDELIIIPALSGG